MDDWSPELAKVVAVETKLYPESMVIQGTRWPAVAGVIWKHFPEVKGQLAKHLPPDLVAAFQKR